MRLSIRTLKIYVIDICRMDLKILSSQMLRLQLLLLIVIQIIILTFLAAGNLAKCRHDLQIFLVNLLPS